MRNRFLRGFLPALALAALAAMPGVSSAGVFVGVSVDIAPPPLPVYVQPPCPQPGYLWVPGYWGWNDGAYYWVPGTWVLPPGVGLLWTPGYWGWDGGVYLWHAGYWGPQVGFYGGVDYGFGYDGVGFVGGYWRGRTFFYNRAVMRVGPRFGRNVYYHPVAHHAAYTHVSFNGGPGGIVARATRAQMAAARMRSDRPSWATGQPHARTQERFQSRTQNGFSRSQSRFQERGNRPMQRSQARPQLQFHQRAPAMRGGSQMHGGAQMHGAPHQQPRSGGRPRGGQPQDHHEGGHGR